MRKKNLSHSKQKSLALRLLTVILAAMLIAPPFFACSGESAALLAESSATRYECETASVGTSATYKTETDAANASEGVYASNTNNVMFVYDNVPESNTVTLRCAGMTAAPTINFMLKEPGSDAWVTMATGAYEAGTTWNMADAKLVTVNFYIPEGSSVAHQCAKGVNYDYVELSYDDSVPVLKKRIEAEDCDASESSTGWTVQNDSYATNGTMVGDTGQKTFVYKNVPECTKLVFPVSAQTDSVITVKVKSPSSSSFTDIATISHANNGGWYMNTARIYTVEGFLIPEGSDIALAIGRGVNLDYIDLYGGKVASSFFEAEVCAGAKGITSVEAEGASGGAYADCAVGSSLTFTNVAEANSIKLMYASTENGTVSVDIFENGEWVNKGEIGFATVLEESVGALTEIYSDIIYIPEGSSVRLTVNKKMILDTVEFIQKIAKEEAELDESWLLAKNTPEAAGSTVTDIMAIVGTAVDTSKATTYTFSVPETLSGTYNNIVIAYKYTGDAEANVTVNGVSSKLSVGNGVEFSLLKLSFDEIAPGSDLSLSFDVDGVRLDYIRMGYVTVSQDVSVDTLPSADDRTVLSLDGIWNCDSSTDINTPSTAYDGSLAFDNTIPVPGLWDMASVSMNDYTGKSLWYKKIVTLPENFDPNGDLDVRLEILRALYGRHIYINGTYVESYPYNFTYSHTDITEYLHSGENEIVIMLGSYSVQSNDASCPAHTGKDYERKEYRPGITDSVNLIFTGKTYTKAVQVAPELDNGKIEVQLKLESKVDVTDTPVTVNVYELGKIVSGTPSAGRVKVATHSLTANVTAGEQAVISIPEIAISGFDKETKSWCPANPYLYEIEVVTNGDTFSKRFGMKTFFFDSVTKLPTLNGKVYYLRGTNFAMYRFFEDPDRGSYPWQEDWARKIFSEFKETNWEVARTHNGPLPSMWYDIADEMGFMLIDEYTIWGMCSKCTVETLLPEYRAMVEEKQTHASILYWDAQNEANDVSDGKKVDWPVTGNAIRQLLSERVDIAERHWDNGWSNPVDGTQPVERHPYPFIGGENIDCLKNMDNTNPGNTGANGGSEFSSNPKIVNEYASLWLNRVGEPTSISKKNYDKLIPNSTTEERFELYTTSTAWLTEFYRSGRNVAGIQQFVGLSYAKPGQEGATGDVLMPDLSNPQIRPSIKDRFKSAFAPLGIIVSNYELTIGQGDFTYPVILVNDYNYDVTIPVTFKVTSGETVLANETREMSVKQAGTAGEDIATENFNFTIPASTLADKAEINVEASYILDGEKVYSLRTLTYDDAARPLSASIAQGKPVTASSESKSDGNLKEKAVDGDPSTRWGAEYRGGADTSTPWITIDCEDTYDFLRLQVLWETAVPGAYEVQISDDGETFTTIATVDSVIKTGQNIDLKGRGRYLKIQALSCATEYAISAYEIYLWGDKVEPEPAPTPENVSLNKTVTASSESAANGNPKEYAVDGDISTRWGSQYRSPTNDYVNPWLAVDFEGFYEISSVNIKFEYARPTEFEIQYSLDGENYAVAKTVSSPAGNTLLTYDFATPFTAKYLKIKANGCVQIGTNNYGMSIFELEAMGLPATVCSTSGSISVSRDEGTAPYAGNKAILTVFPKGGSDAIAQQYIESDSTSSSSVPLELTLPVGKYDYCITKNGYLQYNGTLTVDENGTSSFGDIVLTAGDIKESYSDLHGNGVIDVYDFIRLIRGFDPAAAAELKEAVDINEDRLITIEDLASIKAGFGKSSDKVYEISVPSTTGKSLVDDTFGSVYLSGTTTKNPLEYAVGETMNFEIKLYGDGEVISTPYFKYEITGDDGKGSSGYAAGSTGVLKVSASCSVPGYVRLRVYPCDSNKNVISADNIFIYEGGAGCGFSEITKTKAEPADFDAFWSTQMAALNAVTPTATEKVAVDNHGKTGFDVYDVKIACVNGSRPVSGYITVPQNAESGSLKLKMEYQGYGVDTAYISAQSGYITFYVNPHGIENGRESAYYTNLAETAIADGGLKSFGFEGNDTPENVYFKNMILRDCQGLRYLMTEYADLWNGTDVLITGGSMGAFQATAVAALMKDYVTALNISIPWMCDVGSEDEGRLGGWRPSYCEAIGYYDTVNFAKRVTANTTITAGLGDYICPPSGITALYNGMTCPRTLTFIQNKTHGYTPTEQFKYTLSAQ